MSIYDFTERLEAADRGMPEKTERAMFRNKFCLLKKAISQMDRYNP